MIYCSACCHHCAITPGKVGLCGVRKNVNGRIKLLVYGKAVGMHLDPIEKKPLYHFLPGSKVLSFGTLGCNLGCDFCQNWFQSQSAKETKNIENLINQTSEDFSPEKIVNLALKLKSPAIAYTYNEPTVFFEYALDTMILAQKQGLKNIWVTNGYMSQKTRKLILPYLDAANIDLKSFNPRFYQKICKAKLEPVLENIRWFFEKRVWIELTTLIIPGENDSLKEFKAIANFIKDISPEIPWHISAFYPNYKMTDKLPTPKEKIYKAAAIGKQAGLKFVYPGNI